MGRENDQTLGDRVKTVRQEREEAHSPNRLRELAEQQLVEAEAAGGLYGRTEANAARKTLAELAVENQQADIEADRIREELGLPLKLQKPEGGSEPYSGEQITRINLMSGKLFENGVPKTYHDTDRKWAEDTFELMGYSADQINAMVNEKGMTPEDLAKLIIGAGKLPRG